MKIISFSFWLFVTTSLAVRADVPDGWTTNFPATLSAAAATRQPALVYFTASWCGPCKLMSRTTLTDPEVLQAISGVAHAAVDIDEHPDFAAKHHINAVPTFVILANAGDEAGRATGFQVVGDFLQWLTNGLSTAREVMARQVLTKKYLAEVDQLLGSQETNSIQLAAVKLYTLCDERDAAIVIAAAGRMKIIADRDAAVLLDGLNDPRLAVRIQVANVLQLKVGAAFDVDPWSGAAARERKILGWRDKLTR